MKNSMFKSYMLALTIVSGMFLPAGAANFDTNCLVAEGNAIRNTTETNLNCTANDAGVSDFRITWIGDGCVSGNDTALVKMAITISQPNSDAYNMGFFINTAGGTSAVGDDTTTTQCLHEALMPVVADNTYDLSSGTGPFQDLQESNPNKDANDECGDVNSKNGDVNRTIMDHNNPTSEAIFTVACADNDNNGYVDFAWVTAWDEATNTCTTIAQTIEATSSKCHAGTSDSAGSTFSIPIGVPNLGVQISCTPTSLDIGQTSTCTVTYNNSSSNGSADYIKFKIDYPESEGSVSNISTTGGTSGSDNGNQIDWTMSGGTNAQNIAPTESNTLTFDYTYTGGPDFGITIDTFYDNGTDPESNQNLSSTQSFTTLPVTISYVHPEKSGTDLSVDFSTASEVANVGFNIYAVKGKKWTKLNDTIIPGALDSFEPQSYHVDLTLPSDKIKKIGIAGIDANGNEDRHGPFKIGHESGVKAKVTKVDWKKANRQVKADRKAKKAARKATKITFKNKSVNLAIPKDAVYRVTHDDLLAVGIDLRGQKGKRIALSCKGKGIARHIEGLNKKGKWTKNSFIEFKGNAPVGSNSLYLSSNLYQLSLNRKLAVESGPIEPVIQDKKVFEQNNRYSYSLPQEDPFYDGYFYARGNGTPGALTRTFEMPKLPDGTSTLTINLSAYSFGPHELLVALNGSQIASESAEGHIDWPIEMEVDNTLLREGTNTLTLTIPNRDGVFDYLVYDKLTVDYNDGKANETLTPAVSVMDKVKKQTVLPKSGENYVIISHPLFIGDILDKYVKKREGEGWKIKVVNVEDIYAAYGYGMQTPDAIKAYLKAAKHGGVTHVQLVGASNYDYHDYLGTGAVSFIPSMYVASNKIIHYTPSDTALVLDRKELPALAIGRWPVRTLEDLEAVVDKTLAWETSGQSVADTALFIADETNKGMDFGKQMDALAEHFTANGWKDLTRIYLDKLIEENGNDVDAAVTAARSEIKAALESGVSVTSYSGHSSPSRWSFSGLLKQEDIAAIDNTNKTTLALPLACFTTYADSPYTNTLAHQLLVAGENGAVSIYGASMTSSYGDNGLAVQKVADGLLSGKDLGTAVKDAKRSLGISYKNTNLNGQLLGDVTLRIK